MNIIKIIYYTVSVLSIFLYVISVQFKKKKNILITQVFASLCYLIAYVIVGAWSGAAIEVLEETKDVIFIKIESKKRKIPFYALGIFIGLLVLCSVIFYDGLLSLLPLVINILLFVSTYFKNPKYIRYIMLISGILWGIYNIYVGAYIIVIGNVLEVISAFISIIRYRKTDNKYMKSKSKKIKNK